MKTLKLITAAMFLFAASTSQAQVSINVNVGTPVVVRPAWVPHNHVGIDYYYIPEIQSYYDVNASMYVYLNRGNWVRTRYVPVAYRNYDLSRAHRVALRGYHGIRPYSHFTNHKVKHYNTRYTDGRRYSKNHYYADNRKSNSKHYKNNNHGHRKH
ncbi:hypothetical protein ACSV4D_16090 [Flavobacterium sp. ARAG 55.4]|uniref:YXWGXW repeat-containing protein n=1 Tax=Flavobacterium plantiphilum TaxID=3163297 RepID=A0ABW8XWF8_9FLAO